MADLKARADQAALDNDFEIAVDLYTQAISMSPNDAVLFTRRSGAYMRLRNFTGTLLPSLLDLYVFMGKQLTNQSVGFT